MRWRRRRGPSRLIAGFTAASTAVLAVAGMLSLTPLDALAAGLCATPGGSGAGGTLTGIVNTYYPGVGTANAGATSINVGASSGAATAIASGDMLLVMQMQDADFDFTNTNSYGHGGAAAVPASGYTALNSAGLYEYVRATSAVTAGAVSISGLGTGAGLVNTYRSAAATATAGQRTFQVIRVPQYTTATTSNTLTAFAWNGSVGGVLAVDTTSTLTLGGTVSLNGLGFRGAPGMQKGGAAGLANTDVVTSAVLNANGNKGEGIGGTPLGTTAGNGYPGGDAARGAPANAGGGGSDGHPTANDENSGGGGGGNGGAGGIGGNTWSSNLARGGYGGVSLPTAGARVFLGGGGGAGSTNNSNNPNAAGGNGGGIALIRAGAVAGAGTISANGAAANNTTPQDGGGGGGAGGTVSLTSPSGSIAGATLSANGGRGGDAWATQAGAANQHGPGGGGGGGWIFTSSAPTASTVTAGVHGITTTGNLAYGSADGTIGQTATLAPGSIPGVSGGAECADLSITKTGPATVAATGAVAYTLNVSNAGPSTANTVSVTDTLPAGVTFVSASGTGWTCTNIANTSVTCTRPTQVVGAAPAITVNITAQAQAGTMTNTAAVTAVTPDQNPANNTATFNTTVTGVADLTLDKNGPVSVLANGNVSYTVDVANVGPSDAATVNMTDTLPAGVTFVSVTPSNGGWTCNNAGNVSVTCTRATWNTGKCDDVHHRGHRTVQHCDADERRHHRLSDHRPDPRQQQRLRQHQRHSLRRPFGNQDRTCDRRRRQQRHLHRDRSEQRSVHRSDCLGRRYVASGRHVRVGDAEQRWLGVQQQREHLGHLYSRNLGRRIVNRLHDRGHRPRATDHADQQRSSDLDDVGSRTPPTTPRTPAPRSRPRPTWRSSSPDRPRSSRAAQSATPSPRRTWVRQMPRT